MSIVSARSLSKRYPGPSGALALDGLDLDVGRAEVVSVMGSSGCGKSTLLNLLGGLDVPTSGEVHFAGERVDRLSVTRWARLRRRSIGVVFQDHNLVDSLSLLDNVALPARLEGVRAPAARRRALELLDALGMADRASALPGSLSGGERQRGAIARALVNRPELLLADEPTGALDSRRTSELLELLLTQRGSGVAVVLVTHDPRVATIADRLLTMRDGRIVDETHLCDGAGRLTVSDLARSGDST